MSRQVAGDLAVGVTESAVNSMTAVMTTMKANARLNMGLVPRILKVTTIRQLKQETIFNHFESQ